MKKINKFLTCLLCTAISIASFTVFNVSASEKSWQEAYLEAMDEFSQNPKEYCECRLLYLNEDEIPELYIGDPMVFWYGGLYSYSNGDLIKLKDFGFKDFFLFITWLKPSILRPVSYTHLTLPTNSRV